MDSDPPLEQCGFINAPSGPAFFVHFTRPVDEPRNCERARRLSSRPATPSTEHEAMHYPDLTVRYAFSPCHVRR